MTRGRRCPSRPPSLSCPPTCCSSGRMSCQSTCRREPSSGGCCCHAALHSHLVAQLLHAYAATAVLISLTLCHCCLATFNPLPLLSHHLQPSATSVVPSLNPLSLLPHHLEPSATTTPPPVSNTLAALGCAFECIS